MSRADVIAGVLAEHRWQSTVIRLGPAMECGCGEWVDNHESHVADVLAAAEPAAEQARAGALTEADDVFDRVRALADEWARKCPPNDWPEEGGVEVAVLADAGRAIRAALAGDAEHERSGTDTTRPQPSADLPHGWMR